MPELLLELFSEEIPARMQTRAADDLARLVGDGLKAAGLEPGNSKAYATPRRLALHIDNLPAKSPALCIERKGPRVGAPNKAIAGFLKGAGLTSIDQAEVQSDPKKGDYYVARIDKLGRPAGDIIAEVVPDVISKFPWPKSMRWGSGALQWVRPLHGILCLFGGKPVAFEVAGIASGTTTQGHRFLSSAAITPKDFADYQQKLEDNCVILDADRRRDIIERQAKALAKKHKLALVEDAALLKENAGLNEWPTVLMGEFDRAFLEVPGEVLTTSMKAHQKCFSLRQPKTGALSNHFLLVSNLQARDGGKSIIAGNEKVIAARLADAKFFWDQDLQIPLDEMALKLDAITFHDKLGTQKQRVERIAELAYQIAGAVDANPDDARRAAQLCKADLVSGMVGEFPELQGLMGRYYAEKGGINPEISRAIELHYKPKGPGDLVPKEEEGDAVAIAVALADKLDTLVGFWAIDEKPTGSGDPYQLRRAALGVIRIVLENDLRVSLRKKIGIAFDLIVGQEIECSDSLWYAASQMDLEGHAPQSARQFFCAGNWSGSLLSFFTDRLKVHLRGEGARHDLIDAVISPGDQDDLALIVKRVEALGEFLGTDDGANLLAGVKRASKILAIEEKKDKTSYAEDYDVKLLGEKQELALAAAIESVKADTKAAINVENFTGAMNALAELRAPVDDFFDKVTVNCDDKALRENRLRMLNQIRAATLTVADFSKIAG